MIDRMLIAIDACSRVLYRSIFRKNKFEDNKRIIIVFQQVFGDAIALQDSLKEYVRVYPKSKGYEILMLVQPSVYAFMREVLVLPNEIKFDTVDFKLFVNNYKYYKKIVKKYHSTSGILIIPGDSLSGEIFSAANNAKRKIGLVRHVNIKSPLPMAIFNRISYTERIIPKETDMILQRHRLLLNYLGDKDYCAKLPTLKQQERVIEEEYCVICPGASILEKCWPTDRYVKIAEYIIENYGLKIHLCGGKDELMFEDFFLSHILYPEKIISHIGKSKFSEWSSIVQYASIVISNDSATIHMAAAARRRAICIVGAYDKFLFFPYKVDVLEPGDLLPVPVTRDMPCAWCRTIGYYSGYGNKKCRDRIKNNECVLCIDSIQVDDVIKEVDKLLSSK